MFSQTLKLIRKRLLDFMFGHFSIEFGKVSKFFMFEVDSSLFSSLDDSEVFDNGSFLFVIFQDKA